MTLDAEFEASVERVWQLLADPRQLERWWGPPTYPTTVTALPDDREHIPERRAMEQLLSMGMEEGLNLAVGQIDAIHAQDPVAPR